MNTLAHLLKQIPGLWLAAPMTGLIVQPIIGYMSDRTWHPRLGRRRPYFFNWRDTQFACFICDAQCFSNLDGSRKLYGSSIPVSISAWNPFAHLWRITLMKNKGHLVLRCRVCLSGWLLLFAGYLPQKLVEWFGVSRDKSGGAIPQNIMLSFYIGGAVFLVSVLYTVFKSKEYPPADPDWKAKTGNSPNKGISGGIKEIFTSIKEMPDQMKKAGIGQFSYLAGIIFNVVLLQYRRGSRYFWRRSKEYKRCIHKGVGIREYHFCYIEFSYVSRFLSHSLSG